MRMNVAGMFLTGLNLPRSLFGGGVEELQNEKFKFLLMSSFKLLTVVLVQKKSVIK